MFKLKSYLIVFGTLGLLLSLKLLFFPSDKKSAGAKKDGKKPSSSISTYVVGKESLEDKLHANGTLLAFESAEIKTEASGTITFLHLPEGKIVPEGTLLVKINDAELRAQLEKVKIQIRFAKEAEDRLHKLFKVSGISQQDYDVSRSNLALLQADSSHLAAQISKTEVRAPFTGIIGIRNVSKGSYVTPSTSITHIQQLHPLKLEFSVPEKYALLFKEGDQVLFKTEGHTKVMAAKIAVKDPLVDYNSRSVRFHAHTPNNTGTLLPGSFARVELSLKDKPNALFVPTDAIIPVLKGKKVYVVSKGLAEERLVETGLRTEDYIQVLSGVHIGDSVIIDGNTQVKAGAPVRVPKKKS